MIASALKNIYKKINNKVVHGVDVERMSYKQQMEYLHKFPIPKDNFERSYFKYKCFCEYCYYRRKWMLLIYNIGAMFLISSIHSKLRRANGKAKLIDKVDAVIENIPRLPNSDFMPEELRNKYRKIKEIELIDYNESLLSNIGEEIYQEVKRRYFFHFYYRLIVLQKLGQFSSYLVRYKPDIIAFYSCEREFSSPLQTLLCEKSGSRYISFMHGDYLSTLSFAFQKYSQYYVWDESYVKMFKTLKCDSPMLVYRPKKLNGIASAIEEDRCAYFATYYFSDETQVEVTKIYKVFKKFESYGMRTKIRPHPRFSNIEMLNKVFADIEIEEPSNCSLSESITKSLFVVGLNTTVLSEAYFSGKKVVIDDISNSEKYKGLAERGYVMMNRPHILLSKLLGDSFKKYDKRFAFYDSNKILSKSGRKA